MRTRTSSKFVSCARCGRRVTLAYATSHEWNVNYRHGVVVGYVCLDDQTPMDYAEATVNEATGASTVAREVGPDDPDWWDAVAQHIVSVAGDVLEDFMRGVIASGTSAPLDPYGLADRTLEQLRGTIGMPVDHAPVRDHLAWMFSDWAEAGGH